MSWRPSISWPRLLVIGGWLVAVGVILHLTRGPFWRVDPGALYEQAITAIRGGDDAKALDLLTRAAARDSTNAGIHTVKGYTELRLATPDVAARSFERALELVPSDPEATLGLAEALVQLNRLDSARVVLRQTAGRPLADSQLVRRARLLDAADDPSLAFDAYAQIATPENLATRAALALRAERFTEAVPLLRELVHQGDAAARKDLAYALEHSGQPAAALREYSALDRADQLDVEARVRYAWLLNSQGRHRAAWRVLAPLPRPAPDTAALELQAKTAAWAGYLDEAESLIEAWRRVAPGSPSPGRLAAFVQRERDRRSVALRERETARYPSSGDRNQVEADTAALSASTIDAALWHYARLLAERPGDSRVAAEFDVLWAAAARYTSQASPQALVDLGSQLEAGGRFERALRVYQAAAATGARPDPDVLLRLSRVNRWMSRSEEAKGWLERYVTAVGAENVPDSVKFEIAAVLVEVERGSDGLAWIEPVLARGTGDSAQLVVGARAATQAGRPELAVSYLEQLDERYSLSTDHVLWLAGQYRAAGRPADALARYQQALDAMDAPPDSLRWMVGDLRAAMGDFQGALAAYRVDRETVPDPLRVRAAYALQEVGRWDDAIDLYRLHLAANPGDIDAALALARALARVGNAGEAVSYYAQVVDARGATGLNLEIAQVHLAAERPKQAVPWARRAVDEDGWEAQLTLATALRLAGDPGAADAIFERLSQRSLTGDSLAVWRGRIARARGRLLDAYRHFEGAETMADSGGRALLLAETALERGDYGRAKRSLTEAGRLGADSLRIVRLRAILDSALAAEVGVPAGLADDNNEFGYRELGIRAAFWPGAPVRLTAGAVRSELEQTLTEFQVTSAYFSLGNIFLTPSLETEVRVGFESPDDGETAVSGGLNLAFRFRDESLLGIRGARDPLWRAYRPGRTIRHHRILDLAGAGPSLYVNRGQLFLDKTLGRDIRFRIEGGGAEYSDDNRQVFAYGHVEIPLENGLRRRSMIAPNAYVETFEDQVGEYFSPNRYVALGLRAQTLRGGRRWRFKGEINPHYFDDDDASGFGLEALVEGGLRLGPVWAEAGVFFFTQEDGFRTFSLSLEAVIPLGGD